MTENQDLHALLGDAIGCSGRAVGVVFELGSRDLLDTLALILSAS